MRRKNYNLIGICFLAALAAGVRVDPPFLAKHPPAAPTLIGSDTGHILLSLTFSFLFLHFFWFQGDLADFIALLTIIILQRHGDSRLSVAFADGDIKVIGTRPGGRRIETDDEFADLFCNWGFANGAHHKVTQIQRIIHQQGDDTAFAVLNLQRMKTTGGSKGRRPC